VVPSGHDSWQKIPGAFIEHHLTGSHQYVRTDAKRAEKLNQANEEPIVHKKTEGA